MTLLGIPVVLDETVPKDRVYIRKCPLCIRGQHCGHQAEYGKPEESERCINVPLRCLHCGATGLQSTRKDR